MIVKLFFDTVQIVVSKPIVDSTVDRCSYRTWDQPSRFRAGNWSATAICFKIWDRRTTTWCSWAYRFSLGAGFGSASRISACRSASPL